MTEKLKDAFKSARLRDAEAKAALAELKTAQAYRDERHFAAHDDMVHHHSFRDSRECLIFELELENQGLKKIIEDLSTAPPWKDHDVHE